MNTAVCLCLRRLKGQVCNQMQAAIWTSPLYRPIGDFPGVFLRKPERSLVAEHKIDILKLKVLVIFNFEQCPLIVK